MNEIERIDLLLEVHEMTRADLGRAIGASRQQMTNWWSAQSVPKNYLVPIAMALGVSTDELLTGKSRLADEIGHDERLLVTKIMGFPLEKRRLLMGLLNINVDNKKPRE